MSEEKKFHVYKHVSASAQYVFAHEDVNGQTAHFVNHVYFTDDPLKIAELDRVCEQMARQAKNGFTAFIYIDPNMREASQAQIDPMEAIRAKIREEERSKLMQELQISQAQTKDAGSYTAPTNIVPARPVLGQVAPSISNGPVVVNPKTPTPKAEDIVPSK